jgi:NAD(P)-dependent dehydrogenase (short-subunit alcohol dehydrogenase family)
MTSTWDARQLGSQTGRTFVVTGANSGIGLETSRELVRRGAHVVLAVRDTARGEQARADLTSLGGQGRCCSSSTSPTSTRSPRSRRPSPPTTPTCGRWSATPASWAARS